MITNNDTINYQTRDLLDVVADYTFALDTLDNYDYERLTIGKITKRSIFTLLTRMPCRKSTGCVTSSAALHCSGTRRTALSKAASGRFTRRSTASSYIPVWRRRQRCCSTWSRKTIRSATVTSASPPHCSCGSSTTTVFSTIPTARHSIRLESE